MSKWESRNRAQNHTDAATVQWPSTPGLKDQIFTSAVPRRPVSSAQTSAGKAMARVRPFLPKTVIWPAFPRTWKFRQHAAAGAPKYLEEARPQLTAEPDNKVVFLSNAGESLSLDYLTQEHRSNSCCPHRSGVQPEGRSLRKANRIISRRRPLFLE